MVGASRFLPNSLRQWVYGEHKSGEEHTTTTTNATGSFAIAAASQSSRATGTTVHPIVTPEPSSLSSYWDYASDSLQSAADTTYSTLASVVSSTLYSGDSSSSSSSLNGPSRYSRIFSPSAWFYSSETTQQSLERATSHAAAARERTSQEQPQQQQHLLQRNSGILIRHQHRHRQPRRRPSGQHFDLTWMLHNPYDSVRGRHLQPSSVNAVRSLLTLVPVTDDSFDDQDDDDEEDREYEEHGDDMIGLSLDSERPVEKSSRMQSNRIPTSEQKLVQGDRPEISVPGSGMQEDSNVMTPKAPRRELAVKHSESSLEGSWSANDHTRTTGGQGATSSSRGSRQHSQRRHVSNSETASQLAEGTIRALRDMALDEAVQLNSALRYWTARWERPVLSWLEAGPLVWTSEQGYNHKLIGRKVSQIQAVLARRCAAIGELQQHLLAAGWQRGVAQWGVLGQGGQWAAVAGFDGSNDAAPAATEMELEPTHFPRHISSDLEDDGEAHRTELPTTTPPNKDGLPLSASVDTATMESGQNHRQRRYRRSSTHIGFSDPDVANTQNYYHSANVFVRKEAGGGIFVDDPAFLARWSVDAMALVRFHLERSASGITPLPYESNWRYDEPQRVDGQGELIVEAEDPGRRKLPRWAFDAGSSLRPESGGSVSSQQNHTTICNLPLMVDEVTEILNVMEDIMAVQRERRLEIFRPPGWFRRNWYMVATILPSAVLVTAHIIRKGYAKDLMKFIVDRISSFVKERVREPLNNIFTELWKGRESFSDRKAQLVTVDILKKMIRSWLDENYPMMAESERIAMAEAMDVSLIEKKKEESMKSFFEVNNVVRMSFIEMQYMKKEMMSALYAMDEMMSANDINMNLAAITPVVLLAYIQTRIFQFMYYAFLQLGTSREETYATFRNILTDIERLLVMRDNPPRPSYTAAQQLSSDYNKPSILGADDLGMLMLLVHECRTILWRHSRRFSPDLIRSVSEDLAELAGERGAVSIRQQLQIIERMARTYPFLKVISTGLTVQYSQLRTIE